MINKLLYILLAILISSSTLMLSCESKNKLSVPLPIIRIGIIADVHIGEPRSATRFSNDEKICLLYGINEASIKPIIY